MFFYFLPKGKNKHNESMKFRENSFNVIRDSLVAFLFVFDDYFEIVFIPISTYSVRKNNQNYAITI